MESCFRSIEPHPPSLISGGRHLTLRNLHTGSLVSPTHCTPRSSHTRPSSDSPGRRPRLLHPPRPTPTPAPPEGSPRRRGGRGRPCVGPAARLGGHVGTQGPSRLRRQSWCPSSRNPEVSRTRGSVFSESGRVARPGAGGGRQGGHSGFPASGRCRASRPRVSPPAARPPSRSPGRRHVFRGQRERLAAPGGAAQAGGRRGEDQGLSGGCRASTILHAECLQGCPAGGCPSWKQPLSGAQILCLTLKTVEKKFAEGCFQAQTDE